MEKCFIQINESTICPDSKMRNAQWSANKISGLSGSRAGKGSGR